MAEPQNTDTSANDVPHRWDEAIRESFRRSREYGVPRSLEYSPEETRLSDADLRRRIQQNAPLLEIVTAQVNTLRHILEDSSFCSAIADAEGYVLRVLGEGPIRAQYEKRKCLPGYRWQERDVGTCAIGLALHTKIPIHMQGHQMYSISAQHITNSAVPVFDHLGVLRCVISLSGFAEKVHLHTIGMLIQAAEAIRLQIQAMERTRELDMYGQYLNALVESDRRGIITLDKQGNIVRFNSRAKKLAGLSESHKGRDIDSVIASPFSVKAFVRRGKSFADREVVFAGSGQEREHVASLDPLSQNGVVVGGLFSMMEQNRALKLVNAMAGGVAAFTFDSIIGKSAAIRKTLEIARAAAISPSPVLLLGETGTGKELFAQAIHNASPRASKPFVVINCGAIPRELLESELFGYEPGAFTGGQKGGRPGKLELAHQGTLFLDEIGDMPFDMQVKMLRTLQSGEIQRLGSSRTIRLDLRIITATNADLKEAIAARRFREDLYYRISTISVEVPPLRKRGQDVLLLAEAFLSRYSAVLGKVGLGFSQPAKAALLAYEWPGNVRQLENRVERSVVLAANGQIRAADLDLIEPGGPGGAIEPVEPEVLDILRTRPDERLHTMELRHIEQVVAKSPNISAAAKTLGISRPTLYRKMQQYGIQAGNSPAR
ncbi:sigma 54-interacting transcriptional regulator [Desulfovibrio sp. OttesenSCG-928-G15]|nr:sigma 54-interacting transcriptional regulator [Desulfovibrio sp. OttesenSCG-928-G15]